MKKNDRERKRQMSCTMDDYMSGVHLLIRLKKVMSVSDVG
jgi:hypothetical protein